jgi:phenylpropionate dioxygenase-like ring-hydroxylating dioxygenase large terminal subunit
MIDIDELVQPERGRVNMRVYVDEDIFREELRRIFYTTWVYVAHESELRQPGDYKTTYIGLVPVIVSRDAGGTVHVLVNRCSHRGATVVSLRVPRLDVRAGRSAHRDQPAERIRPRRNRRV